MKRLVMRLAFTGVFLTAGVIAIAHTLMKRQETEGEGPEGEGVALVNGVEDPDDKKKSPSAGGSGIQSRFQIGDTKVSPASGESQGGLGSGTDQNRYGGSPGVASGGAGDVGGYRSSGYGASGAAEQINRGQSAGEPKVLKIGDTAATRDAGASGATGTGAATGGSAMSGALNALRNSQSTAGASTGAVAGGSGGQATGGATQQQAPNVISIADSATGAGGGTTSSPAATGTSASQGYGTSYGAGGGYGATGGAGGYGSTSTGTGTAAADSGSGGSGTGSTAGAGRSTGTGTGSVAGGTGAGGVGGAAGAGGTGNGSQYGSTQYGAGSSSGATGGGTGQRPTRSAPSAVEIQPTYNKNYGVGGTGSSAGSSAGSGVDVANSLASDQPGSDDLEGVQRPALTLEKVGDRETQINVPTTIELFVKNTGNAVAHNVVVTDYVPGGATYDSADPQPQQGPQGQLVWSLGELAPDETKKITLEITPRQVGDIGSVATVTFETPASVRVRVTEPVIEIEQKGPEKVLIGEEIVLDFMVRNTGTGVAKNIVIEEDVPGGFKHTAGSLLEYEI
ncbi:MAG: hypothetical protein QF805_17920, partial [Pirellulaceae bacterium]|nr:hypothetical protein [Pirellulaceae bacterium]